MTIILLFIIYLAFISLGLPDSVFGVAWPAIRDSFGLNLELGGYVSFTITIGTVLSSLFSGYIISKLKTGKVITISVFLTAIALFGFSKSNSFAFLLICAFPLGFGAGSIDTALNNYVAINYKPHHMNWLHSFWGIGATLGPLIMSLYLNDLNWQGGYLTISIIQFVFLIILTFALPLWKKNSESNKDTEKPKINTNVRIFKIKGVTYALFIFLVYCAIEFSVGIWGSSYLVMSKGLDIADAARFIMVYYFGITGGRFIAGILSFKLSSKHLIFGGIALALIGTALLLFTNTEIMLWISFAIIGCGLAPIFPGMIHDTPRNFGEENSQYVIGYQIAFAYIGMAIFPSIFGFIFSHISIELFPILVFALSILLLSLVCILTIRVRNNIPTD